MPIQQIYKSRTPLVSFISVYLALSSTLAPAAVAKPEGQIQKTEPVITLSQLQPFQANLIPTAPVSQVKAKTVLPLGKRPGTQARGKRKVAPIDHFRIGLALKAKGNSNRALIEFLKATQKNPRQINAFYEQALIFRQQGYLKLADSSLEQALHIANSSSKNPKRKSFNVNDLNRIRLLLATVRLEQGNVGSAAEELSRSLGISLTVPPTKVNSMPSGSPDDSVAESNSPTTILQSLHPKIEEQKERTPKQQAPVSQSPQSDENLIAEAWSDPAKKENADDATVSDLIKEGLAGLKDHLFNPLSILGVPRIAENTEKTSKPKKKERRARKSFWREPKRKVETIETAEKTERREKRKRRGWLERRLALTSTSDAKPVVVSEPVGTQIAQKPEEQRAEPQPVKPEPAAQEVVKENDSDLVLTSKTAALTFTKEESTTTLGDSVNNETGSFSLTMPPAISQRISLVAALLSAFVHEKNQTNAAEKTPEKPVDPIDERLKYLAEHGTSSLKEGEAFMFSEESGEATLFMSNGEVIRRTIAVARGHEEVAQLRRPDILIPEELIYNLALMAKILPKQEEPKETVGELKETAPRLKVPASLLKTDSRPHSFSDWLKDVLNL